MEDIVERLIEPYRAGYATCVEAADEIERLRAGLLEIYKIGLINQNGAYKRGFYNCFKIARRTLGIPHMSFDRHREALEGK